MGHDDYCSESLINVRLAPHKRRKSCPFPNRRFVPTLDTIDSLVSADLLALRTSQGGYEARMIGWPQAGRRPVGRQVAEDFHVVDTSEAAKQDQVDPVRASDRGGRAAGRAWWEVEVRPRIPQIGVLAASE